MSDFRDLWNRIEAFQREITTFLGQSDQAVVQRVYIAHDAILKVASLGGRQEDLLKQAVRCVEVGVYRASIVMAWAAVADKLLGVCDSQIVALNAARPKWQIKDRDHLAETVADYNLIEGMHAASLIRKGLKKTLHGMLHDRNQCAHPSDYLPSANEALGFIDKSIEVIKRL